MNMELIEEFEKNNNIIFDVICKTRSEMICYGDYEFIIDDKNKLIIRNKHMCDIRYWGHVYWDTPKMISDAFAYGNKLSMKHYTNTYEFILKNDIRLKGKYTQAFEIYLTDSILQHVFYNIPGGEDVPVLTKEEINYKYNNIPNGCKIDYIENLNYGLLDTSIRQKNNVIININNVFDYTQM